MSIGVKMPAMFAGSYKMEDPHCTLIYLGEGGVSRSVLEQAVNRLRSQCTPITVNAGPLAVYGGGRATVIKLDRFVLDSWREFIEKELSRSGIRSASKYAYNPHVTLNNHEPSDVPILPWDDFIVPRAIYLGRPEIWWKD